MSPIGCPYPNAQLIKPPTMTEKIIKLIEANMKRSIDELSYRSLATAIEKLVREEAEGFAEWEGVNYKQTGNIHIWKSRSFGNGEKLTTAELFTLYQNSKNKSDG